MSSSISKVGASFAGAIAGLLAVVILVLVPVLGVRKELNMMVIDWQELILYSSCLIAGTIGGARLAFRDAQLAALGLDGEVYEIDSDESDDGVLDFSPSDDELPLLTEPVIEESLAGGPKKPKKRFWDEKSKSRTTILLIFLYLVLFVMCAVLCQKLNLGSIVSDPVSAEIIRTVGLGLSISGLYLILRGLFKRSPSKIELKKDNAIANSEEVPTAAPGKHDLAVMNFETPHVPPAKFGFLKRHPVCAGWLVALTGLPLVFQAWFPLLAIPGLFIGMNWMFPSKVYPQNTYRMF
jgi:hypothetical protein